MGYCKFIESNMLITSNDFIRGFIEGYIDRKYESDEIKIDNKKMYINNVFK